MLVRCSVRWAQPCSMVPRTSSACSAGRLSRGSTLPHKPVQPWMSRQRSSSRAASGPRPPVRPEHPAASSSRSFVRSLSGCRVPRKPLQRDMRRTSSTRRTAKGSKPQLIDSLQLKSSWRKYPQWCRVSVRKARQLRVSMLGKSQSWKLIVGRTTVTNAWRYILLNASLSSLFAMGLFARAELKASGAKASRRARRRHVSRRKYSDRFQVSASVAVCFMKCRAVGKSTIKSGSLIRWDTDHSKNGHALSRYRNARYARVHRRTQVLVCAYRTFTKLKPSLKLRACSFVHG
mmetsp:Transcript_63578/g.176294  ORF Transcript_63578/g.176294 Transcript_63578/m.176294 type:complete len:290 (+) Transcript_63578:752-1621(+)